MVISENGNIFLDTNHGDYYQIQQQMALTKTMHCDFVVWSPKQMFAERVGFNEDSWFCQIQKAVDFHKKVVMSELLGRLYTRNVTSFPSWCICQKPDDGNPMICCDNDMCTLPTCRNLFCLWLGQRGVKSGSGNSKT